MQNINKVVKEENDLNYKLKVSYEEEKKDLDFKKICDSINLSDDELMKYTSLIKEASLEYKNCKSCKGLFMCKNNMNGYCYFPSLECGKLNFSYVSCRYKNKLINENKYQKNVTSFDIPREIKEAKMKDIYTDDESRFDTITYLTNYIKKYKKNIFDKEVVGRTQRLRRRADSIWQ